MDRTRNPAYGLPYRGFESHSFRKKKKGGPGASFPYENGCYPVVLEKLYLLNDLVSKFSLVGPDDYS